MTMRHIFTLIFIPTTFTGCGINTSNKETSARWTDRQTALKYQQEQKYNLVKSEILSWTLIITSCDVYCLILNGQTADKLEGIYSNRRTSTSPDESFITPIITLLCYQLNYSNKLSSLYTRGHNSYIMSEYHNSIHSVTSWRFPLLYYIIVCLVSIHCAAHEMFFWFYIYIKYCITTFFLLVFVLCTGYQLVIEDDNIGHISTTVLETPVLLNQNILLPTHHYCMALQGDCLNVNSCMTFTVYAAEY